MRIVLVSGHGRSWDSGAALIYLQLDENLRRLGHDVVLLTEEDYLPTSAPVWRRKLFGASFVRRSALRRAATADVLEVAGGLGWSLFAALRARSRREKPPLLVTRLHGLEFLDEQARFVEEIAGSIRLPIKYKLFTRRWINWQEFRSIALSDLVLCYTSRDVDGVVLRRLKSETDVATTIWGVAPRYFRGRAYEPEAGRVLWWGTWIERKGISTVPRALELLSRSMPEVTLTIGGTRMPPEAILAAFPSSLRARVTVLPFVSRERHLEILEEHDVFMFPSLSEGFGSALAEAMASAMPCVTTLTGMATDWLEHGQNCLLVSMGSPTGLARALERLLRDAELRRVIGTNAQLTARQWTWERFGRETVARYEEGLTRLGRHG